MRHIRKNHKIQKTMKKFYFLFLMTLLTSTVTMQAQTFSQMSEKQRNAELIKMARKVYQDSLFADFYERYGDNGQPTVKSRITPKDSPLHDGKNHGLGELVYDVCFYTNKFEEGEFEAVRVIIDDKMGLPFAIFFDKKTAYTIVDHPLLFDKYKYRSK